MPLPKAICSFFHSCNISRASVMPSPKIGSGGKPAASVHGREVLNQWHSPTAVYYATFFLC